ncbi:MAG: clostripain-related cysteine peptidase [bacterium]
MKRFYMPILILVIFTGCFFEEKYVVELKTDKNINQLMLGEEFEIEIINLGERNYKSVEIEYNGIRRTTEFNKIEKFEVEQKYNKLNVYLNGKLIEKIEIKNFNKKIENLVYVYMAADNDMSAQSLLDISEIEEGTIAVKNSSVLIYLDRKDGNICNAYILVENGKSRIIKEIEEKNSGDEETLKKFIEFGKLNFNSTNNFIILWNHGNGWYDDGKEIEESKRAIGYDEKTEDWLNLFELENGLKTLGKKWEMIIFDACLMNGIEIIYQLKDLSDYILGSAEEVPMLGYNYSKILPIFSIEKEIENIGKEIIDETIREYNENKLFSTYSLISANYINELFAEIDLLSTELTNNITKVKEMEEELKRDMLTYSSIDGDYSKNTEYSDLGDFLEKIEKSIELSQVSFLKEILNKMVIYKNTTDNFSELKLENSSGLSIYLPFDEYNPEYDFATRFGKESNWTNFIKMYQE